MNATPYIELHAHSCYSLLDGVSQPAALVEAAVAAGMQALALTDHDGLYGALPFIQAAQAVGLKPILGAELTLEDASHLTLLAADTAGYANLCTLVTLAHRGQPKGQARLPWAVLPEHAAGLVVLSCCREGLIPRLLRERRYRTARAVAERLAGWFPGHCYLELQRHYLPGEVRLLRDLVSLGEYLELPIVATGNVHYLHPEEQRLHDVLTCIRRHTTLETAGDALWPNDELRWRTLPEIQDAFSAAPMALANTLAVATTCASAATFLPAGHQPLPVFDATDALNTLHELCQTALARCYPHQPPRALLEQELGVIADLDLANYFLIVWDLVRYAREQGIRCQGRGSAANSLVAYLLGITPIDPVAHALVFERFLSRERQSLPDIDLDLAADHREEVIQYAYRRYGQDHTAMACTLVTFRARSAVRDVARVLGFPPAAVERLAGALDVHDARSVAHSESLARTFGADLATTPWQQLLALAPQLEGLPRHLGIHNGGLVFTAPPLHTRVPLEPAQLADRTVTQWDKVALADAGFIKVDLLGLRMLSAIEDAVQIITGLTGQRPDLNALTPDDPAVYAMLCRGESIGVFQLESRAQASLLPNFQPRTFTDLVIEISLIRPGPLQAQMVQPYLRRRQGVEPVTYLHPLLKAALAETLGVLVFQEQVLKVARDLAGFTAGEAELLRRALDHKRAAEVLPQFHARFMAGAEERGVGAEVASAVWEQLQAFGSYAFPKSHAAAFAVLTYHSAWLRAHHPAAFFAALLRHQPMGFYPPAVLVAEARRLGVQIYGVDAQRSATLATLEGSGIRLGLATVLRVGEEGAQRIVTARQAGPFRTLGEFCQRTRLGRQQVEALILGGAFAGWNRPRRQLLWELERAVKLPPEEPLHLEFDVSEPEPPLDDFTSAQALGLEQAFTGVTAEQPRTAPVAHILRSMGCTPVAELRQWPAGTRVRVGGMVAARQQPPTARGMVFLALEDATGLVNVALYPAVAAASREALTAPFVIVEGQIQYDGQSVGVLGTRVLPVGYPQYGRMED